MQITVSIPDYEDGIKVFWTDNASLMISVDGNEVELSANREAMLCMAKQLLYMAYNELPPGSHVHLDSFFCKDGIIGVDSLIIAKQES